MSAEDLDAGVAPPMPVAVTASRKVIYRHPLPIRIMHWINLVALTLMFLSGLQIFNAHPSLYWGNRSDDGTEILSLGARQDATGNLVGVTRIGRHEFTTTGALGVSKGRDGSPQVRGFPSWLTVPGPQWLAMGRRWHFFFAWVFVLNGLCYVGYAFATRHLQRDLWPTGADWRGIGRSIVDHLRFKHPHGEEALRYNILQRLAYLTVIFVFGVGIVLMGLAMSPRMDAVLSPMVEAVGGRQSARAIHFIIAWGFVAFVLIHLFEVLITGVFNQLRGMITGYYAIDVTPVDESAPGNDHPGESAPPEERPMTDRRSFLHMTLVGAAGILVAGCDRISQTMWGPEVLGKAEGLNRRVQALLSPSSSMAKEYTEADISPTFHPNGTIMPTTPAYRALLANDFRDYRLQVDGLVTRPATLSIDELKRLDVRTQITRHDCVEGWSAIGKWQGTALSAVLDHVGVDPKARFVMFHCFDDMEEDTPYYESIDITEARHPQTLLAFALNDKPLPVPNGAPLRLRIGRQLGYKQAKYLARIELVSSFEDIGDGQGGYWEDQGYEWYAGI